MQFNGIYPVLGEDPSVLPVKRIGLAVEFYKAVLSSSVVANDESTKTQNWKV